MPIGTYYQHKAEQCDRLAAETIDPDKRARLREEGKLWREIARDLDEQDIADRRQFV
jgi:hypothetical protein